MQTRTCLLQLSQERAEFISTARSTVGRARQVACGDALSHPHRAVQGPKHSTTDVDEREDKHHAAQNVDRECNHLDERNRLNDQRAETFGVLLQSLHAGCDGGLQPRRNRIGGIGSDQTQNAVNIVDVLARQVDDGAEAQRPEGPLLDQE